MVGGQSVVYNAEYIYSVLIMVAGVNDELSALYSAVNPATNL